MKFFIGENPEVKKMGKSQKRKITGKEKQPYPPGMATPPAEIFPSRMYSLGPQCEWVITYKDNYFCSQHYMMKSADQKRKEIDDQILGPDESISDDCP